MKQLQHTPKAKAQAINIAEIMVNMLSALSVATLSYFLLTH